MSRKAWLLGALIIGSSLYLQGTVLIFVPVLLYLAGMKAVQNWLEAED